MEKQEQKKIMQSTIAYKAAVRRDREAMIGRLIDAAQTLDGAVKLATKGGDLLKAASYAADAAAFRKAAAEI